MVSLKEKQIGFAFTGSFCTFDVVFQQLDTLTKEYTSVFPIFSYAAYTTETRFGMPDDFLKRAEAITGNTPITTIAKAEPIGPEKRFALLIIAPCTGNTLAKLAAGITDTPVLMAAKAHLRNQRPLLLAISTNDALGMNLKNIGLLLNTKHIFFVPFRQDHPLGKPNSMIADFNLLLPAVRKALLRQQYQPILSQR